MEVETMTWNGILKGAAAAGLTLFFIIGIGYSMVSCKPDDRYRDQKACLREDLYGNQTASPMDYANCMKALGYVK